MPTIDLLIDGRLALWADGQVELPRQPPFPPGVLVLPPAALVTVDFPPESPNYIRLFTAWYKSGSTLHVVAGDGVRTWIQARMACVGMEHHEGIQTTVSVMPPIRRRLDERSGLVLPYRAQPTFRRISRAVHTYMLAADRYEFCGRPERSAVAQAMAMH